MSLFILTSFQWIITKDDNRLNNLKIFTDKILGAGSGGTFVFEGKFEVSCGVNKSKLLY